MKSFFSCFFILLFLSSLSAEPGREEIDGYRGAMRALAEECRSQGMTLEAKVTESRIWENPPFGFFVPRPSPSPLDSLPDDAQERQREWFRKMRGIESDYGGRFMTKAKELAAAGKGREGCGYARLAFFVDPENKEARAVFGYRLYEGNWRRDWEIARMKKGFVKDPLYGWVTPKERERFAAETGSGTGDRSVKPGKIRIETEHFDLRTTLPRLTAVRLAQRLEEFYTMWDLLFFPMTMTDKEAAAVILGKKERPDSGHKTVLFRNRDEYLQEILRFDEGGEISSGGYFPDKKTVYLYLPDAQNEEETPLEVMAVHETAHQLFAETGFIRDAAQRRHADPGRKSQFWLTEGIACYLETFESDGRGWTAGGLRGYRFLRAKERADEPDGLLPLKELAGMGKEAFQHHENPAKLYTESAGLVSFFLHGEGEKYRSAFLSALQALYQGEESPEFLEEKAGADYPRLDGEFRAYLHAVPFTE